MLSRLWPNNIPFASPKKIKFRDVPQDDLLLPYPEDIKKVIIENTFKNILQRK